MIRENICCRKSAKQNGENPGKVVEMLYWYQNGISCEAAAEAAGYKQTNPEHGAFSYKREQFEDKIVELVKILLGIFNTS